MTRCTGLCIYRWGFWFRIRGYGLSVKRSSKYPPLFSERFGYRKVWRRLGVAIELCTPTN